MTNTTTTEMTLETLTAFAAAFVATYMHGLCSRTMTPGVDYFVRLDTSGRRFARVSWAYASEKPSYSVVCFVEKATGEVYSPKGWKAANRPIGMNVATYQK